MLTWKEMYEKERERSEVLQARLTNERAKNTDLQIDRKKLPEEKETLQFKVDRLERENAFLYAKAEECEESYDSDVRALKENVRFYQQASIDARQALEAERCRAQDAIKQSAQQENHPSDVVWKRLGRKNWFHAGGRKK